MIVLTFTSVVILFRLQSRYCFVMIFFLVSSLKTDIIVLYCIIKVTCSKTNTVDQYGDWEEANERCNSKNDSLVSIQDIKNDDSSMMEHSSIWSSVKGTFTPWIAYRGK